MSRAIKRISSERSDPPSPSHSGELALSWIARRYGLPLATARVVRELSGLGPQEARANGRA